MGHGKIKNTKAASERDARSKERGIKRRAEVAAQAQYIEELANVHDGRLLRLFLPEGSKSHFLAHKGVVYILNEARH